MYRLNQISNKEIQIKIDYKDNTINNIFIKKYGKVYVKFEFSCKKINWQINRSLSFTLLRIKYSNFPKNLVRRTAFYLKLVNENTLYMQSWQITTDNTRKYSIKFFQLKWGSSWIPSNFTLIVQYYNRKAACEHLLTRELLFWCTDTLSFRWHWPQICHEQSGILVSYMLYIHSALCI